MPRLLPEPVDGATCLEDKPVDVDNEAYKNALRVGVDTASAFAAGGRRESKPVVPEIRFDVPPEDVIRLVEGETIVVNASPPGSAITVYVVRGDQVVSLVVFAEAIEVVATATDSLYHSHAATAAAD
jgi:uncharacterized protein YcgI (DUF1989 family)